MYNIFPQNNDGAGVLSYTNVLKEVVFVIQLYKAVEFRVLTIPCGLSATFPVD